MRAVEVAPGRVEVVDTDLGPGDAGWARLEVVACGLCGTDQHLVHGMVLPPGSEYPVRPGHEVAGIVREVVGKTDHPLVGHLATAHPLAPCGSCDDCRSDQEQRCARATVLGIQAPGGMADELWWPVDRLVDAEGIDPDQAALLPDAVATAHHALGRAALPRGGALAVLGAGGVGTHVLQLAAALDPTARLAAIVRSEGSAARLRSLGVGEVLVGLDRAGRRLRDAVGELDAVVDFSGVPAAAGEGVRALRRGGRLVLGSVIDEALDLRTTTTAVVTKEIAVVGSYSSAIQDLEAVTELTRAGTLDLRGSTSRVLALDEAPAAFALLEDRPPGFVRAVLRP